MFLVVRRRLLKWVFGFFFVVTGFLLQLSTDFNQIWFKASSSNFLKLLFFDFRSGVIWGSPISHLWFQWKMPLFCNWFNIEAVFLSGSQPNLVGVMIYSCSSVPSSDVIMTLSCKTCRVVVLSWTAFVV